MEQKSKHHWAIPEPTAERVPDQAFVICVTVAAIIFQDMTRMEKLHMMKAETVRTATPKNPANAGTVWALVNTIPLFTIAHPPKTD